MKFVVTQITPARHWFATFEHPTEGQHWVPLVCWGLGKLRNSENGDMSDNIIYGMVADENGKVVPASLMPNFLRYDIEPEDVEFEMEMLN